MGSKYLSINHIKYLALLGIKDSIRSRWLLAYSLSYILIGLSLTQFSLMGLGYLGFKSVGRILSTLINLSLYLIPLISLILAGISIVGDVEDGILEWLLSEPISRLEYVLGKYIGLIVAITIATLLGFSISSWFILLILPPEDISKYFYFMGVGILLSAASISIGLLISTISKSRFEALGLSFMAWFIMIFFYDLMVMGISLLIELSTLEIFILSIVNPVDASRILLIYLIDPNLTFLGPTGIQAAREFGDLIPLILTSILILYVLILKIISIYLFRGREVT